MYFTTSWDDGAKEDLRIAKMLEEYGCTGTFYVCPTTENRLTDKEILDLSTRHEIGAHTVSHVKLGHLGLEEAEKEIRESKAWVESITGKECDMFCYPKGNTNKIVADLVRNAGFHGARTVEQLRMDAKDMFLLPTTIQIYPWPKRAAFKKWWHWLHPFPRLRVLGPGLWSLGLNPSDHGNWPSLAIALLELALSHEHSFFHLWGHSREVEAFGMWDQLRTFLGHVAKKDVTHVTNGELIAHI